MARRTVRSGTENVRMGPLAIFTLVTTLGLAVLAVLAVSTSNATLALSRRRAEATTQLYLDERAAQAFVASLDAARAGGEPGDAAEAATPTTVDAAGTTDPSARDAASDDGDAQVPTETLDDMAVTESIEDEGTFPSAADSQPPAPTDPLLAQAAEAAADATDGQVSVSASREGDTVNASFDCGNGRQLDIALSLDADGSFRVEKWRMTTVVNDEPLMGGLFGSF